MDGPPGGFPGEAVTDEAAVNTHSQASVRASLSPPLGSMLRSHAAGGGVIFEKPPNHLQGGRTVSQSRQRRQRLGGPTASLAPGVVGPSSFRRSCGGVVSGRWAPPDVFSDAGRLGLLC